MKTSHVDIVDSAYPAILREIHDPPERLYYCGNLEVLHQPCLGIVGTRRASAYGKAQARHFGAELARQGFCIVSGLAYGIDAAAHEGALEGGVTAAVVAQGLDVLQPARHRALARRIVDSGGIILSEKAPGEGSQNYEYLVRNRIISGLSKGVLVVEAGERSGASNTANQANEQGRQVMCLPGRITDPMSMGTNKLIKEGAAMIQSVQDVLAVFGLTEEKRIIQLSGAEKILVELLGKGAQSPAELAERFKGKLSDLYSGLAGLEGKGLIRVGSGARYSLVSSS